MKYNRLGNTGLFVSEICFGTMTFSGEGWLGGVIGNLGQKEATALIGKSLAAGVNFIDTADVYSIGQSEIMTGRRCAISALPAAMSCWRPRCSGAWARVPMMPAPRADTSWMAWRAAWSG